MRGTFWTQRLSNRRLKGDRPTITFASSHINTITHSYDRQPVAYDIDYRRFFYTRPQIPNALANP